MAYKNRPKFLREGSDMHSVLQEIAETSAFMEDFDIDVKRNVLYPAIRHGFVSRNKMGQTKISATGKKLLASAR